MTNENNEAGCLGRSCDWLAYNSSLNCVNGSKASCFSAILLEADISAFYDDKVRKITKAINKILDDAAEDFNGRKLSFITTDIGILLAWVEHGKNAEDFSEDAVTVDSDSDTVIDALKLKNVTGS